MDYGLQIYVPGRVRDIIGTAAGDQDMISDVIRFFRAVIIAAIFAVLLVASTSAAAPPNMDNWVGTWMLNVQKSQYGEDGPPKAPAVFRQILKIRISDATLDLYVRTEMADGTDVADETHLLDLTGKPHVTEFQGFKPVTETFRQIDPNTIEITLKARPADSEDGDGELTVKMKLMMSADRKTIRETKEYRYTEISAKDKTAAGKDANPADGSVLVFDRALIPNANK
jgi:hypothetical protein